MDAREPPELSSRLAIRRRASSEHGALPGLNYELVEAMRTFRDSLSRGPHVWAQDGEFLELVELNRLTLLSANEQALDGFYRDAYNTIRMALEGYLLARLIFTCERYEFKWIIRRSKSDRSLDEAVARAEQRIRASAGPELVSLKRTAKDTLVAVRRGVPIVDDDGHPTGRVLPFYYSAWKQYRPEEHHLGGLEGYLEREWSIVKGRRGGQKDPRHRQFYRDYFTFDGMVDKLRLNRVLTQKTAARLRVHYNFLSGFSHTTHRSVERILSVSNYRGIPVSVSHNHYHSELGLLYVCHLAAMFLVLGLTYFRRWKICVDAAEIYQALTDRVDTEYGYFWFIFNGPHLCDRYNDANRLSDYQKKKLVRPEDVKDSRVRYQEDPLNRLRELHCTTRELGTGNAFISPFPRDDAWRYL